MHFGSESILFPILFVYKTIFQYSILSINNSSCTSRKYFWQFIFININKEQGNLVGFNIVHKNLVG